MVVYKLILLYVFKRTYRPKFDDYTILKLNFQKKTTTTVKPFCPRIS